MAQENISQEFRLKHIYEIRNYFLQKRKRNELIYKKHKKVCITLNYVEHFLILFSTITGCISISVFASLLGSSIGIKSSAIGFKVITTGIGNYKLIINKKKKKHNKIVLLAKFKLNSIEVLISNALIDSVISHHEFIK